MDNRKHVVIVGGGFGGLHAARALRRSSFQVTLIDRRNFHLFQPLLYQVATGGLSPADIASPLRAILNRQPNVRVLQAEVSGIDPHARTLTMRSREAGEPASTSTDAALSTSATSPGAGDPTRYDFLVIATGARHHYFGNQTWEVHAPGLKTIEDALDIRKRVLSVFERAEIESDVERRHALLRFVVVGGGPTGVELAGALGEMAHHTLRRDFRVIDPASAEILLVEGADLVLPAYSPSSSRQAQRALETLGVTVMTNTMVEEVAAGHVRLHTSAGVQTVDADTVLWGAGVQGSPLGKRLAEVTGAELDQQGRVIVEPDLSVPGCGEIFVLGDLSHFAHNGGAPLPGVAPVAIQQGQYLARHLERRARGESAPPFHYNDRGSLAVIGRHAAVAEIGRFRFAGYFAWLIWLFIHLMSIVEHQNRLLVFVQWGWNYVTKNRSARLITNQDDQTRVA